MTTAETATAWAHLGEALHRAARLIGCPVSREQAAALAYAVLTTPPQPAGRPARAAVRAEWARRASGPAPMTTAEVMDQLAVSAGRARAIVADWRKPTPTALTSQNKEPTCTDT